ncbi:TRAF-like family protein [Hirschfeldia incana]|nr:TRAF-like family protein [Hirschfeldia incana]
MELHIEHMPLVRPIPIEKIVEALKEKYKTSHFIKIDNFSLIRKEIRRVQSSIFHVGGHKWKLMVFPNGYKGCGDDHVSIRIVKQDSVNVWLDVELCIVNQLKPVWESKGAMALPPESSSIGDSNLITHADLERQGYLIGDCCIFGVTFLGVAPNAFGTAECFSLVEKPLNHKVTWMMTRFSSFGSEKAHHSNEFVVGNRKWRIQVHPKGFKEERGRSFSVYLVGNGFINNALKANTIAKFKLRVLDQVNRNHIEKIYMGWLGEEPDVSHGFSDFMPLEKLDEPYLMNDKFYVGVEFKLISVTDYC